MNPFLQIRKAIKRNANFTSDDVRTSLLNLLDALEQDVHDVPEEDEVFEFSSDTEKFSEELKENLQISDEKTDEEVPGEDGEDE
ncbi:hypothetical protein LCGC14_1906600 [marine sediment metagenome]|uniref:Uncharacterized protein n=1 Tax=marine sediment metagenome TaxID=412755 RepID=A0A0F9CFE7_9ZZZZ